LGTVANKPAFDAGTQQAAAELHDPSQDQKKSVLSSTSKTRIF
jgi:hypothetical protein